jgi:hypothetical protein
MGTLADLRLPDTTGYNLHAGIVYDEKRKKLQDRFQRVVERAQFLNKREKENWSLMGYGLSNEDLQKAERVIISEDLKRLHFKEKLERIKPSSEK